MEVIYRGFDGLDVAFEAKIPTALAVELESAKEYAVEQRQETRITFGSVTMKVAETGAKGGTAQMRGPSRGSSNRLPQVQFQAGATFPVEEY